MQIQEQRVGALLLAAGQSTRYGTDNKLLSEYRGKPLIHHVADLVTSISRFSEIAAITGHDAENVSACLSSYKITCYLNDQYASGMASSVQLGVSKLISNDAIMIFPSDMPNLTAQLITELLDAQQSISIGNSESLMPEKPNAALIVPTHQRKRGNPVILLNRIFDAALRLKGDEGVRQVFSLYSKNIVDVEIDCPGIHQDIDLNSDVGKLAKWNNCG